MKTKNLSRRNFIKGVAGAAAMTTLPLGFATTAHAAPNDPPNIILCMSDDQGWGDTSYNGHPILKTPELDKMAQASLRFDRFYSASPVCSPTRGSVLTGRHPNRFGCFDHGYPLREQEITIAEAVKTAGYTTGHFGKWHLHGKRGPGRPIPPNTKIHPGTSGFDHWVSATNFFDLNPALAVNGKPVKFKGDGSDIIVDEAIKFMTKATKDKKPFLAVIWYGSPHSPHRALPKDKALYKDRPQNEQNYYGELAGIDRSVGRLRKELRALDIADNTLFWFCSDNGSRFDAQSTGNLRGHKGSLWEGGIRVPALIEWPTRIPKAFATEVPSVTSDIYPTIVDLLKLDVKKQPKPVDGISLVNLMDGKMTTRDKPIHFWVHKGKAAGHAAIIDNEYKFHLPNTKRRKKQKEPLEKELLYDLKKDPKETKNLVAEDSERAAKLKTNLEAWKISVRNSMAGKDYEKGL